MRLRLRGAAADCIKTQALQSCGRAAQVLSCYALMATGAQDQIELAVGQLLEGAAADRDNVPVVLALATGFMLLRQTPKARQALLSAVAQPPPQLPAVCYCSGTTPVGQASPAVCCCWCICCLLLLRHLP